MQPPLPPPKGALSDGRHFFPIRVYFEDTDFTGIVYHANYLRFIERARTEMLRDLGVDQGAIHSGETGDALFFVVARMQLEFLRPARMDDLLIVETRPVKITAAVIELEQVVRRDEDILFTARVLIAALADGKPRRLPREIREKLSLGEGCVQS
jgi:acyl-CoA thioester hydrolase